jgi:hypothetical protein
MVVRELGEIALDKDLGHGISRHWAELRGFVQEVVPGRTVRAAGRGEDETAHPCCLRQFREPHCCVVVDVVGQAGIQIAQRVVRQRGQMQHRVEAFHVRLRQATDIFTDLRDVLRSLPEVAAREEIGVQADNLMAGGAQDGASNGADIAFMSSQKDSHSYKSFSPSLL